MVLYSSEHSIMSENSLPKHVAIIPDGNRRWAKSKGLLSLSGHNEGVERVSELARRGRELGIHTMTFWGLSTENFVNREKEELTYLFELFRTAFRRFADEAKKDGARFIHLGRKDRLPGNLKNDILELEKETQENKKHILNICIDYGGRDELLRAARKWREKGSSEEDLTEENFSKFFDTTGQPYPNPDLIIRTSGEHRLSGFLSWQAVYAELYFEPSFFPDFTAEKFDQASAEYAKRQRRFGK